VVDTDVLVHALDRREPEKRERAREVLRRVGGAGTAALPTQVLSEFANACLRKLEPRPDPTTVRREVERLMLAFPVLPLTGPVVLEALRGVGEHMLSYYDAQIWAVARLGQVAVVLSEDSRSSPTESDGTCAIVHRGLEHATEYTELQVAFSFGASPVIEPPVPPLL
jgi:predicted nucleic acid-binding protein